MHGKKIILMISIFVVIFFVCNKDICMASQRDKKEENQWIAEFLEDSDMSDIQKILNDNLEEIRFSFLDYIMELLEGKRPFSVDDMAGEVKNAFLRELKGNKSLWYQCLVIALLASFFSNVATIFQNKMVG